LIPEDEPKNSRPVAECRNGKVEPRRNAIDVGCMLPSQRMIVTPASLQAVTRTVYPVVSRSCCAAFDLLKEGYRSLARHEATHRPRADIQVPLRPGEDYWLATMEGASRHHGLAAVRLRSDRFSTRSKKWSGRPGMFCGLVLLYELESGELAAIINDGYLQLMRVSATSALAGRYLARPESRVLGIIGSGWQARDHARAFATIFPLERIRVFSPNEARRNAFALEK
jgi:alanine dehydrogenase